MTARGWLFMYVAFVRRVGRARSPPAGPGWHGPGSNIARSVSAARAPVGTDGAVEQRGDLVRGDRLPVDEPHVAAVSPSITLSCGPASCGFRDARRSCSTGRCRRARDDSPRRRSVGGGSRPANQSGPCPLATSDRTTTGRTQCPLISCGVEWGALPAGGTSRRGVDALRRSKPREPRSVDICVHRGGDIGARGVAAPPRRNRCATPVRERQQAATSRSSAMSDFHSSVVASPTDAHTASIAVSRSTVYIRTSVSAPAATSGSLGWNPTP